MITPAISVLSAVEGRAVITPLFERQVIPVTIAILVGLFPIQRQGTARLGGLFGPNETFPTLKCLLGGLAFNGQHCKALKVIFYDFRRRKNPPKWGHIWPPVIFDPIYKPACDPLLKVSYLNYYNIP